MGGGGRATSRDIYDPQVKIAPEAYDGGRVLLGGNVGAGQADFQNTVSAKGAQFDASFNFNPIIPCLFP